MLSTADPLNEEERRRDRQRNRERFVHPPVGRARDAAGLAEVQREQDEDDEDDERQDPAAARPDLDRLTHGIGRRRPAAVADDRFVGNLGPAVPADHRLIFYRPTMTRKRAVAPPRSFSLKSAERRPLPSAFGTPAYCASKPTPIHRCSRNSTPPSTT